MVRDPTEVCRERPSRHSQRQIPSCDTIHFALPLQLISLLLHSKVLLQLSILQSRSTLSWHSLRLLLTHYWLFFSYTISKLDGVNQCDKDSGLFSPWCLNHFPVARSLLMEGINISRAPGICWVCYFGILWKWQLTFTKSKAQGNRMIIEIWVRFHEGKHWES